MNTIKEELMEKNINKENIVYIDIDKYSYDKIDNSNELEDLIADKFKKINGNKYLLTID